MNYLPDLRNSLVEAARRTAEADVRSRSHQRLGARSRRSLAGLRAVPAVIGVLVAIVIAIVALTQVRRAAPHANPTPPARQVPGRQALLNVLGVLRRPQTPSDLSGRVIERFLQDGAGPLGGGKVERSLIRRATTTPWGSPVYIIPEAPSMGAAGAPGGFSSNSVFQLKQEGVDVEDAAGGGCCAPASVITRYGDLSTEGAGRAFAGGASRTRLVLLVPDGVAKVAFVLPRQVDRSDPTAPVYGRVLTTVVAVHGNIAAVEVPREIAGGRPAMIWYAPDGHVVKRLGDPAQAKRVLPGPKLGAETPKSRAAEHNPSTPNRVWVTPVTGRVHANYSVHFRILLNDADYGFHFSGTRCPGFTFAGGQGGGTGDLRGRVFNGVLGAIHGQAWCPGTYHVSVTVMDLGRAGKLKYPAKPFGTATFTVRR